MIIRSFVPADLVTLARIYCRCFAEPPWHEKHLATEVETELASHAAWSDTIFLVAEIRGQIVGAVIGFTLTRKSDVQATIGGSSQHKIFYLAELFVRSDLRGQGVGSQLIAELLSQSAKQQYEQCALRTSTTSELLHLYGKQGFRVVATQSVTSTKIIDGQETSRSDQRVIMTADIS